MAILIKRYANRKLYNTEASRYITLKGIAELLEEGQEVHVVDNETGEDITSVALSQILVDSERKNSAVPRSLISQIVERGGDALYGALRRGIDDASGGFEDLQDRMRRIVHTEGGGPGPDPRDPTAEQVDGKTGPPASWTSWLTDGGPDVERFFERTMQQSVERVFRLLDLPRRSDVESLNKNLERVADAIETLERAYARAEAGGNGATTAGALGSPKTL